MLRNTRRRYSGNAALKRMQQLKYVDPSKMTDDDLIFFIETKKNAGGHSIGQLSVYTGVNADLISSLLDRRPELRDRWNITKAKRCGNRRSSAIIR